MRLVRPADPEEIPTVHRLMLAAFEEYRSLPVPSSALDERVEAIARGVAAGTEAALLCLEDGVALGCCRFRLAADGLSFSRLAVLPSARRRGLATSMLAWLEAHARAQGLPYIRCRVRSALTGNLALYRSLGYRVVLEEEVRNPNGYAVQTAVMVKDLTVETPTDRLVPRPARPEPSAPA